MKTRILSLILAGILAAACMGCGGSASAASSEAAPAESAEAEAAPEAEAPAEAPAEEAAPAESAEAEAPAAADDLLAKIQAAGTMTVAMEGDWAPWTYHGDNDELTGYDVDVAKAIGEKLGVEVKFIEGEWDGLLSGMEAGRYDLVVNGVDVTPDRAEKYDFSEPYAYIRTALVVRADNEDIKSFEDLNGRTTANSIGSTYMEIAEGYGATVSGVDTLDETIQMVLQGRVDATLNADQSFFDYLREHPDAEIKIVAETEEANSIAIPMRKGEETASLREAVSQAIIELKEDGTLTALSEKYFGSDVSK